MAGATSVSELAAVTVQWVPVNASAAERQLFDDHHASMNGGWGGTFDQLGEYLKGL